MRKSDRDRERASEGKPAGERARVRVRKTSKLASERIKKNNKEVFVCLKTILNCVKYHARGYFLWSTLSC